MIETEKRILLIDADDEERKKLEGALKNEYPLMETGKNFFDAIKKIGEKRYSCLIMDVNLPEMKGYDAVFILKKIDPEIKVIMTTKKNSKRLETKVREQDIFFYFIKSFGTDELKLAVSNIFTM